MSDEFKKLDNLMKRNVPLISEMMPLKSIQRPAAKSWPSYVLAMGLCSFLAVFMLQKNEQIQIDDSQTIEEILAWDVTSDEMSDDFEFTVAMLDGNF